MTTYPLPADPVSALTNAAGSTRAHSVDHGRIIEKDINAKAYLKGNGTEESASQVSAMVTAATGKRLYFPKGTYLLPSGTTMTVTENTQYVGDGLTTVIKSNDAYAFSSLSGAVVGVVIKDMTISLVTGATSGGAIKALSASYHSGWLIENVTANGVATSTDAVVYLDGWINNSIVRRCTIQGGGGHQLYVNNGGFASNAAGVYESRVTGTAMTATTYAGIYIDGNLIRVRDCTAESVKGYGVYIADGSVETHIEGCWFEDNYNTNLYLGSTALNTLILGNSFHAHNGSAEASAHHVHANGNLNSRHHHRVIANNFQDNPASGVDIQIDANAEDMLVMHNRGANLADGDIVNSGTRTMIFKTDHTGSNPEGIIPFIIRQVRVQTTRAGASSGASLTSAENVFSVADDDGTNYFMVGSRGIPIFRTGDTSVITGSDELQTNSFGFYWDNTAGMIKARVRKTDGTYVDRNVAGPAGSAYTQTYSTADKTHAAPTAAALTVTDGAGTNDNTIGAITADASVIAAVQEIVDEINKLVADVADVKQVVNSIIDDGQTHGLWT